MKLPNLLKANDLDIRKFIILIISIQMAIVGLILSDIIGIHVLLARQIVGFIYLTFVPGFILLRVLKLHNLSTPKTILLSIGLSVATLMFIGLLTDIIYPVFGILNPLSTNHILIAISVFVVIFLILAHKRDKFFSHPYFIELKDIFPTHILILCNIFFITIFGAYTTGIYKSSILSIFAISLLLIVICFAFFDSSSTKWYSFIIFIASLSLIYHQNLLSTYLTGSDIHRQYYFYKMVEQSSYWNPSLYGNINSMLSITILPVIYSKILHLPGTWIFKLVYPLFFALVPTSLYLLYKEYIDERKAFISSIFFISLPIFWVLQSMTQYIAEFFLVLILLLQFTPKNMKREKTLFISLVFAISMIVSHYGTTSLFIITTAGAIIFFMILQKIWPFTRESRSNLLPNEMLTIFFTILCMVIVTIFWYNYTGGSSILRHISFIYKAVIGGITNFSLPIYQSKELQGAVGESIFNSVLRDAHRWIFIIVIIMIPIGFLKVISKKKGNGYAFKNSYLAMVCADVSLILMMITLPNFAIFYNPDRIFHFTLIFLAPLIPIGILTIREFTIWFIKKIRHADYFVKIKFNTKSILIITIFSIYFVFNTGVIYSMAGFTPDTPSTITLSFEKFKNSENPAIFTNYYYYNWSDGDIVGAKWLSMDKVNKPVYADFVAGPHVLRSYGLISSYKSLNTYTATKNGYFYLFELNLKRGVIPVPDPNVHNKKIFLPYSGFKKDFDKKSLVYSNGGTVILNS